MRPSAAAQRQANGNLLATRQAPGEQYVRKIEAGDEQHDCGQGEQHDAEHGQIPLVGRVGADAVARQGTDDKGLVLLLIGQGLFEIGGESLEDGPRGGGGDPPLQASHDIEIIGIGPLKAALGLGFEIVREQVEIAKGEIKLRAEEHHRSGEMVRGDADERERVLVRVDGLADELRVEAGLLPVKIAGDGDGSGAAGFFFLGEKAAALHQRHFERAEVVRADEGGESAAGDLALPHADHGHVEG